MEISRRHFAKLAVGAALLPVAQRLIRAEEVLTPSPHDDPAMLSISEASVQIRAGTLTSAQLTEACLARIALYDPKLNAFITVMSDEARVQAARMDVEGKAGKWRGPLHGIPLSLKDLIDTAGIRTTEGSAVFAGRVPTEDATVTRRLKMGGAIIIGKANLHEFGMNGAYFGLVRNPWDLSYYSGGSSSGSGAAVSACLCCGSLGTATGGSVRGPASYCGIVGLKPTYGLVPMRGIFQGVLSLDHCGPMARTVEDTAILLNQLAGYDELDITSVEHPPEDYVAALKRPVDGFRLGIAPQFFDHLDPGGESRGGGRCRRPTSRNDPRHKGDHLAADRSDRDGPGRARDRGGNLRLSRRDLSESKWGLHAPRSSAAGWPCSVAWRLCR